MKSSSTLSAKAMVAAAAAATAILVVFVTDSHAFAPVRSSSSARISNINNNFNNDQRYHLSSSTSFRLSASSLPNEEDLELTRQIIMAHIKKMGLEDGDDDEDDDITDMDVIVDDSNSNHNDDNDDYPQNDLMIRAALGCTPIERTPVWLFRQAGRHLPEYNEYKTKVGRSFLDMLSYPEDVAECTMQPIRRYNVDAAILFSDILVIAEALNVEVTMPGGVGIQVPCPLVGPADMKARLPPKEVIDREFVMDKLGHVMESVRLIRSRMKEENISIPLIGFSAAPWTLLFYMVGGSSKKNTHIGMEWLHVYPEASRELLDMLTNIIVEYMSLQVENGAHMLQLFEAMGMMIEPKEFDEFAMPALRKIAAELKGRYPDVPLMVFARGASYANAELSKAGYDVITIDGSVNRSEARSVVEDRAGLQGNYDPALLIEANGNTIESVKETARQYLEELGPQRLIANLGEGLGGKESPMLVNAFVEAIHEESERMIREAK
jgi:uroporphyrinogen decarboxylase